MDFTFSVSPCSPQSRKAQASSTGIDSARRRSHPATCAYYRESHPCCGLDFYEYIILTNVSDGETPLRRFQTSHSASRPQITPFLISLQNNIPEARRSCPDGSRLPRPLTDNR